MLNFHEIKSRIKGVEDTKKITRAMQLISASKLKKAMRLYESNHNYFTVLRSVIKDILKNSDKIYHRYFIEREGKRVAFLIIASDKGLAGEYNKKVLELAYSEIIKYGERYIFTVGDMAADYLKKQGIETDIEFLHIAQNPTLDDATHMTYDILDLYDNNALDEVYVIYTAKETNTRNKPTVMKLLPLDIKDFKSVEDFSEKLSDRFDFEPSPQDVFDILTPHYLIGLIYGALVQSSAAEHFERMVAMKTALDNSEKMLKSLGMQAQRARQEKITTEIQEISMAALNARN